MGHEQGPRADLYLEGSDQHRGWFHSSLTGAAIDGHAPYRGLLTHGFTVDENGRKMSKSLGNVIAPQEITDSMGADILRLWVSATDYSGEMAVSSRSCSAAPMPTGVSATPRASCSRISTASTRRSTWRRTIS